MSICTGCPLIFVLAISGFLKASATKGMNFLEWDKREDRGLGGKRGIGGEEEKRTWQSNLSCFQTVIYENKIYFFCDLLNYFCAIILNIIYSRVLSIFVAFFSQPQEREDA